MDQPIRVVVANQPRLMRELVLQTLAEEPDIEILAEVSTEVEIVSVVDRTQPDFLIVALDKSNQRPPVCDVLLHRYPEMKILALAPERNSSTFICASLEIRESPVESSEAGILSALHDKSQYLGG
jgi:DNA-binding NarL/FixJ family response regulator